MASTISSTTTSNTPTLSSPGLGSGLDVTGLVTKLMSVETQPLNALNSKQASYQATLTAYGLLQGTLSGLQSAAQALETPASFAPMRTSVADSGIMTAVADGSASAGSYNVEVDTLAVAQKLRTATGVASTTQFAAGTLTLDFGSYSDTTFTADTSRSKTITISSSNNTLSGIRDAINGANAGVSASIVSDGTSSGSRLVLTANNTGAANAVRLSVNQTGTAPSGGSDLSIFAYDASGQNASAMDRIATAGDATLKVDGMSVTSSSNVVTGAIQGVTLTLSKTTGTGVTTALTLNKDNSTVQAAIASFVKAYNSVNSQIKSSTAYDAVNGKAATLTGDSTARTIQTELRAIFSKAVANAPTGSATLADIGVTFQKDGSLAIDSTKLSAALANSNMDVSKIFASSTSNGTTVTGYAKQVDSLVTSMLGVGGLLAGRQAGVNTAIASITKQKDAMNIRLAAIQKNYLSQFTALDSMLSSMNNTSTYLTQQLDSLASLTKAANK